MQKVHLNNKFITELQEPFFAYCLLIFDNAMCKTKLEKNELPYYETPYTVASFNLCKNLILVHISHISYQLQGEYLLIYQKRKIYKQEAVIRAER